jgi:hypothetical protein
LKVRRALKLLSLPPELPEDEVEKMQARMVQEARAAQVLADQTHHVVRVFDVGYSPERAEPFLVMELLEGETLTDRLARGRMTTAEALEFALVIAQTLAIAHKRNIVHRDLKPDNVMLVERDGRPGFVKLLDFGLVKMDHAEVTTASGRMMGTLQYMPPEQLRGQKVDARADVFSFGAVLFELLSGLRANPGRTQQEIFNVLLDTGARSLAEVCPDLPNSLCSLVDDCLSLDRSARPGDAAAVVERLEHCGAAPSGFAATIPSGPSHPAVAERSSSGSLVVGEVSVPDAPTPSSSRAVWWIALLGIGAAVVAAVLWPGDPLVAPRDAGLAVAPSLVDASATPAPDVGPLVDAARTVPDAARKPDAAPPVKTRRRVVRGIGRLRTAKGQEAVFIERPGCGGANVGDRLVTARWKTPGYGSGRCRGEACVGKLAQAVQNASEMGETLRVEIVVSRDGEDARNHSVRCSVRPRR